jgi:hypothetical protein
MPIQVCPRCRRVNPADAAYCHFDGMVLVAIPTAGVAAPGQLLQEFVFPSKRRCKTLDDFVQGCQYEWDDARDLLHKGHFTRYFTGIGRMDLARACQEAEKQADPDIALHNFLRNLPASSVPGPKLDLSPRRLVVSQVRAGQTKQVMLKVLNQGRGILQGKVTVAEGPWLRVGDNGVCPLKATRDQDVAVTIETRGLSPQAYSGRLVVVTNGGLAEVPVRVEVGAAPFPTSPFKGAASQRELAEKMRANPKAAVPLLESGEVQRWFAANGWPFPVRGVPARGIAAVQQFFEGMGLSKPPPLQLSENDVHCVCVAPEVVSRQLILRTPVKKWVYAQVDADVPWLRVTTPNVAGAQQAAIAFELDSGQLDEGRVHEGHLKLTANAGQKLQVRVRVDVRRPARQRPGQLVGPVLTVALLFLLYRLLFALPGDLWARVLVSGTSEPPPGSFARWAVPATDDPGFLRTFVLTTWWAGTVVGVLLLWRRGSRSSDVFSGALAGTMAGVATAVTAACVITAVDFVPRLVVRGLADTSAWVATPLWLLLVLLWWAVLGVALGTVVRLTGRRGRQLQGYLAMPLTAVLEAVGLTRAASTFTGR